MLKPCCTPSNTMLALPLAPSLRRVPSFWPPKLANALRDKCPHGQSPDLRSRWTRNARRPIIVGALQQALFLPTHYCRFKRRREEPSGTVTKRHLDTCRGRPLGHGKDNATHFKCLSQPPSRPGALSSQGSGALGEITLQRKKVRLRVSGPAVGATCAPSVQAPPTVRRRRRPRSQSRGRPCRLAALGWTGRAPKTQLFSAVAQVSLF